jgi:hypothetical protein
MGWSRRSAIAGLCAVAAPAPSLAADYSEAQLNQMFTQGGLQATIAADYVAEHPGAVIPVALGNASLSMWRRGDRAKAAFWLYVYQIRMMPWMAVQPEFGDMAQYMLDNGGREIGDWAGSDLQAWQALVRRAIAFEGKAALYPEHPQAVKDADWPALVASARRIYLENFEKDAAALTPSEAIQARTKNRLYVGPWKDPGAPLLDAWR